MKVVECGGARVAYRVEGEGPALVLVHGTGGNAETNWGHLVPDLARHWRVVRPDYSGSGETRDDGGALGVERLAAEVVAAAEAAGAVPFDLVGFSLGAAVAMKIAAEHPHLVRRLVLLGAFLDGADARKRMQFELWRDLIRTDREAMARLVLLTGFSPAFLSRLGHDGVAQAIGGIVSDNDWEGMARQVELDLTIDVRDAARRIAAPTLVIGCLHDHMVPAGRGARRGCGDPGCTLYRDADRPSRGDRAARRVHRAPARLSALGTVRRLRRRPGGRLRLFTRRALARSASVDR